VQLRLAVPSEREIKLILNRISASSLILLKVEHCFVTVSKPPDFTTCCYIVRARHTKDLNQTWIYETVLFLFNREQDVAHRFTRFACGRFTAIHIWENLQCMHARDYQLKTSWIEVRWRPHVRTWGLSEANVMSQVLFSMQCICSRKTLGSNMGALNVLLVPSLVHTRPVTSLGHQGWRNESGPNFLNYGQHIFPDGTKYFAGLYPHGYGPGTQSTTTNSIALKLTRCIESW